MSSLVNGNQGGGWLQQTIILNVKSSWDTDVTPVVSLLNTQNYRRTAEIIMELRKSPDTLLISHIGKNCTELCLTWMAQAGATPDFSNMKSRGRRLILRLIRANEQI